MKRVLAITMVLVAAAPAGAKLSKKAYFRLDARASQHVAWSGHATFNGCGDSVSEVDSAGTGDLTARDLDAPWAVAQRTNDGHRVTFLVHGEGAAFAASGKLTRDGHVNAVFSKPPADPNVCRTYGGTGTPDCGTRVLPAGAVLYVNYFTPSAWSYPGPKPKTALLALSGPYVPEWSGIPPFNLCPTSNGDDRLAGSWYDTSVTPQMTVALPLAKLFGTAKRLTVRYADTRTVQTARPASGSVLADDHPVTTTIHWTVRLTRLAKPQLQTPDL
jgi:hypothetical protein